MYSYNDDGWFLVVGIVGVTIILALIIAGVREGRAWDEFKVAHKCKEVAEIEGEIFNTFGSDSKGGITVGVGSTSDKIGWACDDGKTYFKNK